MVATARALGGAVVIGEDPSEAVAGADAVFTDIWPAAARAEFVPYRVDEALMKRAAAGAVFVHCLPARRGEEVTADVLDGPASLVWQQVANHLPVAQALLYFTVTDRPRRRDDEGRGA